MDNPWAHFLAVEQLAKGKDSPRYLSPEGSFLRRGTTTYAQAVGGYGDQIGSIFRLPKAKTFEREQTMALTTKPLHCITGDEQSSYPVESNDASMQTIPRRNLSEAFDELYVDQPAGGETTTPAPKQTVENAKDLLKQTSTAISPAGVADLNIEQCSHAKSEVKERTQTPTAQLTAEDDSCSEQVIHFELHHSLKRTLSQALVNRVSVYGIIHDINKEATAMAANDFATLQPTRSTDEGDEAVSPLVMAVNGRPNPTRQCLSMAKSAVIDEERWLLSAIENRTDEVRSSSTCPPTFLQAMGEREYEKPISSHETSRTQLWKPSRSWWEAKSGKNPWIEPKSHNKRWRYLWPLIHYHKFLAKCIKKLKRNGVDVKVSVSPVAVFLREEVCAVSDHLAAVSLFTSEQWMDCLAHFTGWIDAEPEAQERLRKLVSNLALRPLSEPGDVDSAILRSQIDDQFLKAMVSAREQLTNSSHGQAAEKKDKGSSNESQGRGTQTPQSRHGLPLHPQTRQAPQEGVRAKSTARPIQSSPSHGMSQTDGSASSRPSYSYHPAMHWYGSGWGQHFACDESSVQSALSGDSFPLHVSEFHPGVYPAMPPAPYYPPMLHPPTPDHSICVSDSGSLPFQGYPPLNDPYHMDPNVFQQPWYGQPPMHPGDPSMYFGGHPPPQMDPSRLNQMGGLPPIQTSPQAPSHHSVLPPPPPGFNPPPGLNDSGMDMTSATHQTPYKQEPHGVPMSPYWGHLDYATLAMTGLMSPNTSGMVTSTPTKPKTKPDKHIDDDKEETAENDTDDDDDDKKSSTDAKPLLFNQSQPYFSYGSYGSAEGFVPPSPATQFMMSPQHNSQAAAYYAYNFGYSGGGPYGFSPQRARRRSPKKGSPVTPKAKPEASTEGAATPSQSKPDSITPPVVVRKIPTDDSETQDSETQDTMETEAVSSHTSE